MMYVGIEKVLVALDAKDVTLNEAKVLIRHILNGMTFEDASERRSPGAGVNWPALAKVFPNSEALAQKAKEVEDARRSGQGD